jgi:hypothetical protein
VKNPDETIDQVLAGLREAEAPEGMERRILVALRGRAPGLRKWRSIKLIMLSRLSEPRPWATAIAGIAIVAVAVSWATFGGHRIGHRTAASNHLIPAVAPLSEAPIATATVPSLPTDRVAFQSSRKVNPRRLEFTSATESVALRELRAPSHPAPPMPLTEQEQLLRHYVQTRNPLELVALNPAKSTTQDAVEKAKFDKFMDNSPTGDDE